MTDDRNCRICSNEKKTEMTKLTEMTEKPEMTEMTEMIEMNRNCRNDKDRNYINDKKLNDRSTRMKLI